MGKRALSMMGVATVVAALFGWLDTASAGWGPGGCPPAGGSEAAVAPACYSVMMIRDHKGTVTTEVLPSPDVKKRQQEVMDAYKAACKAAKEGQAAGPAPQKPNFKLVESAIRGKDAKTKAEAAAARAQEEYDKKQAKSKGEG